MNLEAHVIKLSSIETCEITKMVISYYNVFNLGFGMVWDLPYALITSFQRY